MYIYKFTHIESGRSYIGQTTQDPNRRRMEHISRSKTQNSKTFHFHNALKKYGIESFTFEIITSANSLDELNQLEEHHCVKFDTIDNGFNVRKPGGNKLHHASSIEKMKNSQKIAFEKRKNEGTNTFTHKDGCGMTGKSHNQSTKEKMHNSALGRTMSDDIKKKISKSKQGSTPWNKGVKGIPWSAARREAQLARQKKV